VESELFGHEKGAFTGAATRHTGKFEQAQRGTLFLDEIGDMPLPMQAKLLRVLEQNEIERVGGDRPIAVDVRVIVATHRRLETLVQEGKFRQDLYHRIYVYPLALPALRERRDDIPSLVEHFARQITLQNGWKPIGVDGKAIELLQSYAWPGNVRELRNVVERLLLLATDNQVDAAVVRAALPELASATPPEMITGSGALAERVDAFERNTILAELKAHQYHITHTAQALGLERSHLYKKCQQLGIDLQSVRKQG
jgi:DNA-binding NtrC family response regulator